MIIFMNKLAAMIVKARVVFLVLFLAGAGVCVYFMRFANVNYDMTKYLPADSPTSVALNVMQKEFGNIGYLQVRVAGVTADEAEDIADSLKGIEGVDSVIFDSGDDVYYRNSDALIKVNLESNDFSEEASDTINRIRDTLSGEDIALSGYAVEAGYNRDMIGYELNIILLMSVGVVLVILLLTSRSWADPLVFLFDIGVALLLNLGTNALLHSISFVSNAICAVLQLALAMDYSIIILHRYNEERARTDDKFLAMRRALSGCVVSVAASSLTTVAGLCALMVMRFTIGLDIGGVLAKAIVCSLLTAFFFLPSVILLFDPLLQKTKHRGFLPKMDGVARYASGKSKYVVPLLALALFVAGYLVQRQLDFIYDIEINKDSGVYADRSEISSEFGPQNPLVILVPKGDPDKEKAVIDYVKSIAYNGEPAVSSGDGLATTELYDRLTVDEAADRYDTSADDLAGVYDALGEKGLVTDGKAQVRDILEYLATTDYITSRARDRQDEADDLRDQVDALYSGLTAAEMAEKYDMDEEAADALWAGMGAAPETPLIVSDVLSYAQNTNFFARYAQDEETALNEDWQNFQKLQRQYTASQAAALYGLTQQEVYGIMYASYGNTLSKSVTMKNYALITALYQQSGGSDPALAAAYASVQAASAPVTAADIHADPLLGALMNDELISAMFATYGVPVSGSITNYQMLAYISENQLIASLAPAYSAYQAQYDDQYAGAQALYKDMTLSDAVSTYGITEQQAYVLYSLANPSASTKTVSGRALLKYLYEDARIVSLDDEYWAMVDAYAYLGRGDIMARSPVYDGETADAILRYYGKDPETGRIHAYQLMQYTLANGLIEAYGEKAQEELDAKRQDALGAGTPMTRDDVRAEYGIEDKWLDEIFGARGNPESLSRADLVKYVSEDQTALKIGADKLADVQSKWDDAVYAEEKFEGPHYSRLVFNISADIVSDKSFHVVEAVRDALPDYYGESYVLGSSVNIYDIRATFSQDVTLVNIVNIIAVFLIVMLSFRSVSIPLVLVACIQGAVFVNLSINTVTKSPVYFVCYLIAICIQMGATIDYGILLTDRYCHYRLTKPVDVSIRDALNGSISTVLTSGLILIIAAGIVGFRSTVPIISYIGKLISQGAAVSILTVVFILPCCLCLFDRFLEKGSLKRRFYRAPGSSGRPSVWDIPLGDVPPDENFGGETPAAQAKSGETARPDGNR